MKTFLVKYLIATHLIKNSVSARTLLNSLSGDTQSAVSHDNNPESCYKCYDYFTEFKQDLTGDCMESCLRLYGHTDDNCQTNCECLDTVDFIFEYVKRKNIKQASLNIQGGESLFHPNILDILKYIKNKKEQHQFYMGIAFITNAVVGRRQWARASEYVDFYTISFGLRNTKNLNKVLSEAFRVLKPGGWCWIHHANIQQGNDDNFKNVAGRSNMDITKFRKISEEYGFEIIQQDLIKWEASGNPDWLRDGLSLIKKVN
mgnify:CR=1 FL=1